MTNQAIAEPVPGTIPHHAPGQHVAFGFLPMGAAQAIGCAGLLMLGVQPVILDALRAAGRLTIPQMTLAATIEMLALGIVAGIMGGAVAHRHLRLYAIGGCAMLAAANLGCLVADGVGFVLLRGVAGTAGGVLIWVTVGLITRSTAAVRLSAVFLGAQSVTQAIVAALIPFIEPGFGANAGALALAVAAAACVLLIPAIPDTLPDFPPPASDRGSLNLPGGIALLGTFLLLGGIVGFWVFAEGLGAMDNVAPSLVSFAIAASLVAQVGGAVFVAVLGDRLPAGLSIVLVAAGYLLIIATVAWIPADTPFLIATLGFGFLWTVGLPLFVPLMIEADPSRRAALLLPGAQLLGGSIGPQVTGFFATETDLQPVMVASSGMFLGTILCTVLVMALQRRRRAA
jgi:MFS transporter, DHA1 family, inner membrane transport protein